VLPDVPVPPALPEAPEVPVLPDVPAMPVVLPTPLAIAPLPLPVASAPVEPIEPVEPVCEPPPPAEAPALPDPDVPAAPVVLPTPLESTPLPPPVTLSVTLPLATRLPCASVVMPPLVSLRAALPPPPEAPLCAPDDAPPLDAMRDIVDCRWVSISASVTLPSRLESRRANGVRLAESNSSIDTDPSPSRSTLLQFASLLPPFPSQARVGSASSNAGANAVSLRFVV